MRVFLDLEQTLIASWEDHYFLFRNIAIINQYKPLDKKVTIFSYAIDNIRDYTIFIENLQDKLEKLFDIYIEDVIMVDELQESIGDQSSMNTFKHLGKMYGFLKYVQTIEGDTFVLIDDAVPNKTVTENGKTVIFVNV